MLASLVLLAVSQSWMGTCVQYTRTKSSSLSSKSTSLLKVRSWDAKQKWNSIFESQHHLSAPPYKSWRIVSEGDGLYDPNLFKSLTNQQPESRVNYFPWWVITTPFPLNPRPDFGLTGRREHHTTWLSSCVLDNPWNGGDENIIDPSFCKKNWYWGFEG